MYVLIATPFGTGGQGGIDRLMDSVRNELAANPRPDVKVEFQASRGKGSLGSSLLVLARFCALMALRKMRGRVDLVHINLAIKGSTYRKILIARWAELLGVSVVLHLHAGKYQTFWEGSSPLLQRRIEALFLRASRVVVLGEVWANFVRSRIPARADRIVVLPNGAPALKGVRSQSSGLPHILFLGRLNPEKGIPELVDALAALPDGLAWRATLAGDGQFARTAEHLHRVGLGERVTLPGWVDQKEVDRLLASADILVLPSHIENLPMCIIEAMASGVAVIATPVGAVEEIVTHGETGLIVPVNDVGALSSAMLQLLQDAGLREDLARRGLALHRRRLDITPYTDRLIAVWKDAADPAGS